MMQFSVKQEELRQALKVTAKTLSRRPHLPVLAGILIQAEKETLTLTSTDLTAGTKATLPAQVKTPGQATVNGKTLLETVGFFEHEDTEFILGEKALQIINTPDRIKIPLLTEEYPDFNLPKVKSKSLALSFLETVAKKVAFTASSDQSRPALTGVLWRGNGEVTQLVCTDGFRLCVWQPGDNPLKFLEGEVIVSAKAIADIVALGENLDLAGLDFAYDQVSEQLLFSCANFTYFTKAINSNYPPFEKIIPLEFGTRVSLDRESLSKNLTKAAIFTKTDSNTVKISFEPEKVVFTASSQTEGSFTGEQVAEEFVGSPLNISFNIRYLQDFLSTRESEVISVACNEPTSPALFTDPGAGDEFRYIVMPFKFKN